METIFARATAAGKAGVAVIRISGPHARLAAERLAGPLPVEGRALRILRNAEREPLDQALCLTFSEGHSFTGECVTELQIHGSPAAVSAVLAALQAMEGLRPAEPGEFTRRALENNRLDLTQVEGLADLIDAETEAQRRQAFRVFAGALGQKASGWRRILIEVAALAAAAIDFSDEDVPADLSRDIALRLEKIRSELDREQRGIGAAERLRDGFEVAILGAPNAGKSTLLNAISGRQAAITSHLPGTTRDIIEVRLDIAGLPVTMLDTAGLRAAVDEIEKLGVDLALRRAETADLRIWLLDPGESVGSAWKDGDIVLRAKADINPGPGPGVSGKTAEGVPELIVMIADKLHQRTANASIATRDRHRRAIARALFHLDQALEALPYLQDNPEFVAEETNLAIRAIDSIVGRVDVEDILSEVFARFCIGK